MHSMTMCDQENKSMCGHGAANTHSSTTVSSVIFVGFNNLFPYYTES